MAKIRVAILRSASDETALEKQLNYQEVRRRRKIVGVGHDDTKSRNFIEFQSSLSANKLLRLRVKIVPPKARKDADAFKTFIAPLVGDAELLERAIVLLGDKLVEVVILRGVAVEVVLPAPRLPAPIPGNSIVPKKLFSDCVMERVICHWSEGVYKANQTDLKAYHILIEGDGKVVGGIHPISDNVNTSGSYAAHTLNKNTKSIGVSCCCMVGCKESPFSAGSKPLTKSQWDIMVQVIAELCRFYGIKVTTKTVLGHGEVQSALGIMQRGKWDPMVWPWEPSKSHKQVGTALRKQVSAALAALATTDS